MTVDSATNTPVPEPDVAVGLEALTLSAAIIAFVESGLLDLLEQLQPATCADLGRRAHVNIESLQLLLDALESAGIVMRDRHEYPDRWKLNGTGAGWRTMMTTGDLQAFLDTGKGHGDAGEPLQRLATGALYRDAADLIASMIGPIARSWASQLATPDLEVLEIGAGAAPWSRELLTVEPSVRTTVVDLEPVIATHGRALVDSFPTSRITLVPADVFGLDFQPDFDLVVVSAFCRLFGPATNELLFERVGSWVRPGGRLLIGDAVDVGDPRSRSLRVYALNLATRTANGRIYSLADFTRWVDTAGFDAPTVHPTRHGAFTILLSTLGSNRRQAPMRSADHRARTTTTESKAV